MAEGSGGNIISRIIRLVLDQASAKKSSDDAKESLGGIESALKSLKSLAINVGEALAAAFAIHKIVDFAKESVNAAIEMQKRWALLAGTIEAAGESYDKLAPKIRAQSELFMNATVHGPAEYATALQRLIVLTGDVNASMHNMGLVANVAARFYGGELEPAAQLVAKAMNGLLTPLTRLGIHAKSAQEALDILAARSMDGAAKEADTFSGKLKQLNNQWEEFKVKLGESIISSKGGGDAVKILTNVVKDLGKAVVDNKEAIGTWANAVVGILLDASEAMIHALQKVAEVFGWFDQKMADYVTSKAETRMKNIEAWKKLGIGTGLPDEETKRLLQEASDLNTSAASWKAWGRDIETARLAWEKIVATWNKGGKAPPRSDGSTDTVNTDHPLVSKNATLSATDQAYQKYLTTLQLIEEETGTYTNEVERLGVEEKKRQKEIDATNTLIQELVKEGYDPASDAIEILTSKVKDLGLELSNTEHLKKQEEAFKAMEDAAVSAIATQSPFTTHLQDLQSEAERLTAGMKKMQADGVDPLNKRYIEWANRLRIVNGLIQEQTKLQRIQTQVASDLAGALFITSMAALVPYAKQKAQMHGLEAADDALLATTSALFGDVKDASKYLVLAEEHAAMAAAWAVVAGGVNASIQHGGGGGAGISAAQSVGAVGASSATPPSNVITIYVDGINPSNPNHQALFQQLMQETEHTYGRDSTINILPWTH